MVDDLFMLIVELTQAENDTERAEIAARIVDADGRADSAELSDMENVELAGQIIKERIKEVEAKSRF